MEWLDKNQMQYEEFVDNTFDILLIEHREVSVQSLWRRLLPLVERLLGKNYYQCYQKN